eukprot:1928480-Pleurochrysis_carterae.AAC.2
MQQPVVACASGHVDVGCSISTLSNASAFPNEGFFKLSEASGVAARIAFSGVLPTDADMLRQVCEMRKRAVSRHESIDWDARCGVGDRWVRIGHGCGEHFAKELKREIFRTRAKNVCLGSEAEACLHSSGFLDSVSENGCRQMLLA